jgi:hypothetical protein
MSLPLWLPPLLAFVATIISGLTLFGECESDEAGGGEGCVCLRQGEAQRLVP